MRIHALAFGALLDSQNADPHSRLERPLEPAAWQDEAKHWKEMMASWWNINSREDLLNTLSKLQSGEFGSRHDFWVIRRRLLEGKMENYSRIIAASSDGGAQARALLVATHLAPLRGAALPLAAWDFGRYINLCRWGVKCGWLSEQEAWDRIVPAGRLLQASYTSWDAFASDYLLGRNFWDPESASQNDTIRYRISLLEHPPKGLWSTIPWNEPLGSGETLHDPMADWLLEHYSDPDPNGVSMDHLPSENPLLIMIRTGVDSK
jgi:hypothetical protein